MAKLICLGFNASSALKVKVSGSMATASRHSLGQTAWLNDLMVLLVQHFTASVARTSGMQGQHYEFVWQD